MVKNTNFSTQQILALQKTIEANPKLLLANEMIKINKSVSYMAFILKEMYDFANLKTQDGTFLYQIKDARTKYTELKEKQAKFLELKK